MPSSQAVLINPFLPGLATALLARWPEAVVRRLEKTDSLNPKGRNLSRTAHDVLKCKKTNEKLDNEFN